jgi:hypothetical protein
MGRSAESFLETPREKFGFVRRSSSERIQILAIARRDRGRRRMLEKDRCGRDKCDEAVIGVARHTRTHPDTEMSAMSPAR